MKKKVNNLLLVFAKYPEPGLVKTRLGKIIGNHNAASLYQAFLEDITQKIIHFCQEDNVDCRWVYVKAENNFPNLIESFSQTKLNHVTYVSYNYSGLLIQQIEQFQWAKDNGYSKVVGISTDVPQIPFSIFKQSFLMLEKFDVVIGPNTDGGYYLLGTHPPTTIQDNVEMSTNHVFKDITVRANEMNLSTHILPTITDIDEVEDIYHLINLINNSSLNACPKTIFLLQELGYL